MTAISLSGVKFAYSHTGSPVFSDITFDVTPGSRVVLVRVCTPPPTTVNKKIGPCSHARGVRVSQVGANGAGKSTLLRLVAGRRRASGGVASVLGGDAFECTTNALRVNLVTADWETDLTLPVRQLVSSAIAAHGVSVERVARLLEVLGIPELLHAELHALSDGQQRRVQLFCKLLPERELVLLDEATNSLDVLSRASLLAFLKDEADTRGSTVVFATHIFDGLDGWVSHATADRSFYGLEGRATLAL